MKNYIIITGIPTGSTVSTIAESLFKTNLSEVEIYPLDMILKIEYAMGTLR